MFLTFLYFSFWLFCASLMVQLCASLIVQRPFESMELLLNIAWIMLALPAYWLCRKANSRGLKPLPCVLTLSCVLVLLFPVISATDDLHAVRAEMEDSAVSKRAVRQSTGDKGSAWANRSHGAPALAASASWLPMMHAGLFEPAINSVVRVSRPDILIPGRAPPFLF